jgi:hypothetical protein
MTKFIITSLLALSAISISAFADSSTCKLNGQDIEMLDSSKLGTVILKEEGGAYQTLQAEVDAHARTVTTIKRRIGQVNGRTVIYQVDRAVIVVTEARQNITLSYPNGAQVNCGEL